MARRNIAGRGDIEPDALRQRRDMYVLAIGLLVFNLAGGTVGTETSFSGILPVKLLHPWVLIAAAWVGLFYFWFRFWLVSEVRPIEGFLEDVKLQLGAQKKMRFLAASMLADTSYTAEWRRSFQAGETIPAFVSVGSKPSIDFNAPRSPGREASGWANSAGVLEVPGERRKDVWTALIIAIPQAVLKERVFTDYTLPHLFAMATVSVGLLRLTDRLWLPWF